MAAARALAGDAVALAAVDTAGFRFDKLASEWDADFQPGIVKYGEAYGDDGLWEGQLYVFDGRMGMNFSDHTKTIGRCVHCDGPTSNYENCAEPSCNELVLICKSCMNNKENLFHTMSCREKARVAAV